jgi:hypothetical protein
MSQPIVIGPARIADREGTHEPGEVVDFPSAGLVELAESAAVDPESGEPYCTYVGARPSKKTAPAPAPDEAPDEPENT